MEGSHEMNPRLSIVTISFNQGFFLEECIKSVLDQRGPNDEYIVVDPGSTDESRQIIERYRDRIDHVVLDPDRGPADGLNKGFSRAAGDVFGYVNADDRLAPDAMATVRHFFRGHPSVDVLCGAIRIVDRDGKPSLRRRTADRFNLARYAAGICTVGQQGTFFRADAFRRAGGFNADNRITWDGELLVDLALAGARFATTGKVLGDFRIYGESITGSGLHREKARRETARIVAKMARRNVPLMPSWQARLGRILYRIDVARHMRYLLAR
jgi:glycosyltransferase involved in cell wall biosynthesis